MGITHYSNRKRSEKIQIKIGRLSARLSAGFRSRPEPKRPQGVEARGRQRAKRAQAIRSAVGGWECPRIGNLDLFFANLKIELVRSRP